MRKNKDTGGARNTKGVESEQSKIRRKKRKAEGSAEALIGGMREYGNKLPTKAGPPKKKKLKKKGY